METTPPPYMAFGSQRVISGYAGPLFTLRRDDGTTLDVSPQTGGDYPDYDAIDTWAGGNVPTVTTLYDQTGNTRHLTQATVANQPSYDTTQRFGNAVPILFDGFGRTATAANPQRDKNLQRGSLTGLDAVAMSAFMAMQPQTSYNTTGHWVGANEAGSTGRHEQKHGNTQNCMTNRIGGSNRNVSVGTMGPQMRFEPQAFGASVGAGVLRQFANGVSGTQAGASTTSVAIERMILGKALNVGASNYGAYRLFGCMFHASALTQAQGDAVIASMNTAFGHGNGFGTAPEYNLLFIGDSITEGTGSRLIENYPSLVDQSLTRPRRMYVSAEHGQTQATCYSGRVNRYGATFAAGIPNVAFIQLGLNDIGGGAAGATLYANTTTPFIAYLKGLGYKVVVCTLTPVSTANIGGGLASYNAYNDAVRANTGGADAVLDLTANPVMGPVASGNDTSLYPDGTHPGPLGYRYLAGAPSGTYANAHTFYDTVRDVLRTTALGGAYVP